MREIRSLTGLRGVAAVDVALTHVNGSALAFLNWFAFHNAAVDIFFCLSSFTLCLVYGAGTGRPLEFRGFAVARFARVYPLYAIVLLGWIVYCASSARYMFRGYTAGGLLKDGILQVLMMNAWPVIGSGAHWIDPMWSLSVEAFCYVSVFPVLFWLSGWAVRLPVRVLVAGVVALGLVTFGFFTLFYNPGINSHQVPPATGFLIRWVAPVRGTCMFAAGWLAYLLYLRRCPVPVLWIAIVMMLIVWGQWNVELLVVLTPFLLLGLARGGSVCARILGAEPLRFLGVISYSIYLLHWPVMLIVRRMPWMAGHDLVRVAVTMAAVLVAAAVSYHRVERPLRVWLRARLAVGQGRGL